MKPEICVYYIGENNEDFVTMSLRSVLEFADHVIFLEGHHDPNEETLTVKAIQSLNDERIEIHRIPFEHYHLGANGRQRNRALDIIKEKWPSSWVLRLDPDEVVDENGYKLRQLAEWGEQNGIFCFNLKME
ncbi:MAG: hypothetical protein QMD06_03115, partial [Candidatus Altarchaeum sp.]|nr:hypothetical protein [Candidatus Altarchaeum sp.]